MQDKRFQVFISSTYLDLKDERRAVEETITRAGDFPVQMEAFPAADEDQFDFIKSLIDECDYYILIIAGKYGSLADDGISYTEKEYQYAVSIGVPVLVMLHDDRGSLPANKTEPTDDGKKKLEVFIQEVTKPRLIKYWNTSDALKLAVREALDHAKKRFPRVGWVRGDSVANIEALTELNQIRKENEKLKSSIKQFDIDIPFPDIPDTSDEITIRLVSNRTASYYGTEATIRCSWIACFPIFYHNLSWEGHDWEGEYYYSIDDGSRIKIGSALASEVSKSDTKHAFTITEVTFDALKSYFIEIGFMSSKGDEPFTEKAKRFARRQSIANMNASTQISLVEGDIDVHEIDSIPF